MAKITEDKELVLTTAEAIALVKNADGRVRFQVPVRAFLPTSENRGFDGLTYLSVSRTDFMRVIRNVCGDVLERRGARIKLKLSAPNPEYGSNGLSFISLG